MNKNMTESGFGRLSKTVRKSSLFSAVLIVAILLVIMLFLRGPAYFSSKNIYTLCKVIAVSALIGFSQMIVISSGGMNVSIGATGALCAILSAYAMDYMGVSAGWSILIGIAAGAICGLINGLLIYRAGGVGVAFFLTTLATMSVFEGINLTITKGNPIYGITDEFLAVGNTLILGLPSSFFIMLFITGLLIFMFKKMKIGRQILAYGANHKAALLYGVSKFKVVLLSNIIASIVAAIAGMLAVVRIEAAQPNMGAEWMLMSFAATLIGGTSLVGGKNNTLGTIFGAATLTIISNALVHLKVDVYWNSLIYGVIILLSVTVDRFRYIRK